MHGELSPNGEAGQCYIADIFNLWKYDDPFMYV